MNPEDPESAQRIVAEYAALLEAESERAIYPSAASVLPYPKQTIKQAMRTCVRQLGATGQMTDELRTYLELAYISLADYLEDDLVKLLTEFREASETLAVDGRRAIEKVQSPAWNVLSESSRLTGMIAKTIADETEALRLEFQEIEAVTPSR
jgi:hypothetical protein